MVRKVHRLMTPNGAELSRVRCGKYGLEDPLRPGGLIDSNHGRKLLAAYEDAKVTCVRCRQLSGFPALVPYVLKKYRVA